MTSKLRIAFSLNVLVSIALIAIGLRYVCSSQIMPYHLQVIGRSWNELDPNPPIHGWEGVQCRGRQPFTAGQVHVESGNNCYLEQNRSNLRYRKGI
jgi:hypothetical protein